MIFLLLNALVYFLIGSIIFSFAASALMFLAGIIMMPFAYIKTLAEEDKFKAQ